MEAMYYPSVLPAVRPYSQRAHVPREIPLDLSVKTVRQTADSTADCDEIMILEQRKVVGTPQGRNHLIQPTSSGNTLNQLPFRTAHGSHQHVATSSTDSHPVMTSLLQQTCHLVGHHKTQGVTNQSQSVLSTGAVQGHTYSSVATHPVYSHVVYPNPCFADKALPLEKSSVNGKHIDWRMQQSRCAGSFCRPAGNVHQGFHMKNHEVKAASVRQCNGTCSMMGVTGYPLPLSDSHYPCAANSNVRADPLAHLVAQSPVWNTSGLANLTLPSAVAPSPLPHIKKKEGASGNQKESPRTARDFPGQLGQVMLFPKAENHRTEPHEVIVIDDDCVQVSSYGPPSTIKSSSHVIQKPSDATLQVVSHPQGQSESDLNMPSVMPCLEAVSPNENRRNADSSASPLGPPPLIAAVSSPLETVHLQDRTTSSSQVPASQQYLEWSRPEQDLNNSTQYRLPVQSVTTGQTHCDVPVSGGCKDSLVPGTRQRAVYVTLDRHHEPSITTGRPRMDCSTVKGTNMEQTMSGWSRTTPSGYFTRPSTGLPIITGPLTPELQPSITTGRPRLNSMQQRRTVPSTTDDQSKIELQNLLDGFKPYSTHQKSLNEKGRTFEVQKTGDHSIMLLPQSQKTDNCHSECSPTSATKLSDTAPDTDAKLAQNSFSRSATSFEQLRMQLEHPTPCHLKMRFESLSKGSGQGMMKEYLNVSHAEIEQPESKHDCSPPPQNSKCESPISNSNSNPSSYSSNSQPNSDSKCKLNARTELTNTEQKIPTSTVKQSLWAQQHHANSRSSDLADFNSERSFSGEKKVLKNLLSKPAVYPITSSEDLSSASLSSGDLNHRNSRSIRKRSMLECLADSQGYVAEKKKRAKTNDLFADPSQLSREDRALQRAMLRFKQLEQQHEQQQDPPSTRLRSSRASALQNIQDRNEDRSESSSDSERRAYKSAFIDFQPEVLASRTRRQMAALRYHSQSKKYNKNAAYEEELRREAKRLAGFRARRRLRKRLLARLCNQNRGHENHEYNTNRTRHESHRSTSSDIPLRKSVSRDKLDSKQDRKKSLIEIRRTSTEYQDRECSRATRQWRQKRIRLSCQMVRRRRLKSGLDMIARKKKPKSSYGTKDGSICWLQNLQENVTTISGKITEEHSSNQDYVPDLKKFMVNKALGETALHRAARQGHLNVVLQCLQTKYCSVNARDNAGYTPLHECCSRGHLAVARALLQYGADVNASAAGGIRPMHDAVENDHVELVRLLLSYGADSTIATYSGHTPARLARSSIMVEFIKGFLSDVGSDIPSHLVLRWQFNGSARCLDPSHTGYDVCEEIVSETDTHEDDDFLFEVSDTPHLPTFRFLLPDDKHPQHFLRLCDVLQQTGLSKDDFLENHPELEVLAVPRHEFDASATCSQILTAPQPVSPPSPTLDIIRLNDSIRAILGIESVTLR